MIIKITAGIVSYTGKVFEKCHEKLPEIDLYKDESTILSQKNSKENRKEEKNEY